MPTSFYEKWRPGREAQELVAMSVGICNEYAEMGYDLTLRQLYYQHVARGVIPNSQRSYKRLGDIVNRARMSGLMDWDQIVDRTRNLKGNPHWSNPSEIIRSAAQSYRLDTWQDQPVHVEVWVEKEALAGVIARVAPERDVHHFSCRGYVSQSEQWRAGQRFLQKFREGKRVVILHLGDHDPSGIDMTRDITDRLTNFTHVDWLKENLHSIDTGQESLSYNDVRLHIGDHISDVHPENEGHHPLVVRRIALNYDQVERYDPPPNPAKLTDARANSYIEKYGMQSWELDALPPDVLASLINDNIDSLVDEDRMQSRIAEQEVGRQRLLDISSTF